MTERLVPVAEHITGPGCITEGLEIKEKLGGKDVYVIPAEHMHPFHWLMIDPEAGSSEGEDQRFLSACFHSAAAAASPAEVGLHCLMLWGWRYDKSIACALIVLALPL
jgi:hypothetical protein